MKKNNKIFFSGIIHLSIISLLNYLIITFLILNSTFLIAQTLDQLEYSYNINTNQLSYIKDAIGSSISTIDLDNQSNGNYKYDANGQLIADASEGILKIEWTVTGKVKEVSIDDFEPRDGISDHTVQFKYDAMGNRVKKTDTKNGVAVTTYYVRNAMGELISIYDDESGVITRKEIELTDGSDNIPSALSVSTTEFERKVGDKNYELNDHLGNVRVTISDTKEPNPGLTTYNSQLTTSIDYYSFGMLMPGRSKSSDYRFGFNGKEADNESKGEKRSYDFGNRFYDPLVGQFLSIDRYAANFPFQSPYIFAANNPVCAIDINGDYVYFVTQGENGPTVVSWGSEQGKKYRLEHIELEIAYETESGKAYLDKYINNPKYDIYVSYSDKFLTRAQGITSAMDRDPTDDRIIDTAGTSNGKRGPIWGAYHGMTLKSSTNDFSLIVMRVSKDGRSPFRKAADFIHEIGAHVEHRELNNADAEHTTYGETVGSSSFECFTHNPDGTPTPGNIVNREMRILEKEYDDLRYEKTNGWKSSDDYTPQEFLEERRSTTSTTN